MCNELTQVKWCAIWIGSNRRFFMIMNGMLKFECFWLSSRRGVAARGNRRGITCWILPTGRAARISSVSSKICPSTSASSLTTRVLSSATFYFRAASTSPRTTSASTPTSSVGRLWYSFSASFFLSYDVFLFFKKCFYRFYCRYLLQFTLGVWYYQSSYIFNLSEISLLTLLLRYHHH